MKPTFNCCIFYRIVALTVFALGLCKGIVIGNVLLIALSGILLVGIALETYFNLFESKKSEESEEDVEDELSKLRQTLRECYDIEERYFRQQLEECRKLRKQGRYAEASQKYDNVQRLIKLRLKK